MAGGQATNSGINYQQRIAAWCLINQFTDFNISVFFDQLDEELIIDKTHFETSEFIDDLNLTCKNYKKIFLQIKRSLSLSVLNTSDFYKTITQFINEFIKNEKTENYFGLITTSDASSKITNDLKKIVISIRLNTDAFEDNPLNESEKDTLKKFESLFNSIYNDIKKIKPSKDTFKAFAKRIFVGIIDIESGQTVEIASLTLLKSIGFNRPELIWSILIKNSLIYATNRLSIDKNKLNGIFNKYLDDEKNKTPEDKQTDFLKTNIIKDGEYPTAKEVLLIESFYDKLDFMIIELYRFKDDCQIKHTFYDNKIFLESGDEWTIIQRFATMTGLERFLEINEDLYKDKRIAIIPANDIDTVEYTECAKLHQDYLGNLISKNINPLLCLHCGKQVRDYNSLIIEVEDRDTPAAVGLVHSKCLRPIDRILGTIKIPGKEIEKHLESFDFKLWVSLIMKGQGMLNALKASPQLTNGKSPIISWNSREEYDPEYSYCIKFILEDGSTSYAYRRNRIERVNKPQALELLELFKTNLQRQNEQNDPLCVLSISKDFAAYSILLKIKKADDVILEIKSAEIAKYSKLIAKAFDKDIYYYAPLCIVRDRDSEEIINLSNVVPIISDPLQFNNYFDNWNQIGFKLDDLELKIIKSDKDFDNNMRMIFEDGLIPIIDPIFDKNFNLVSGYPINEQNRLIAKMKEKQSVK